MSISRRTFIRGSVSAFTLGCAAPAFLSDLAIAAGARSRNLVIIYLSGGNDALNTVVPYTDAFYYSRRPFLSIPAGQVLQVGSDAAGNALGLHPRLNGLHEIFNEGRLAIVQRAGYPNSSRSHFESLDIWGTGSPSLPAGPGWLGRYVNTVPSPVDALFGWNTSQGLPHALLSGQGGVATIPNAAAYSYSSPNRGNEAINERSTMARIASHVPVARPYLSFVNGTLLAMLDTLDRVASVTTYAPSVAYPASGFAQALQMVAGSMVRGTGTRIYWVQTDGYDTHANQGTAAAGMHASLLATFGDGLYAFYRDLQNQALLNDTLVVQFSEFGRRINENGGRGTDHGGAGVMLAAGGAVRGGIYGTAASLDPEPDNPTLENKGGDVTYETDFRSVYAKVLDGWLGADSAAILGGNFRAQAPPIV